MRAFIIRRIVYNIPVYLAIVFLVMALLRVRDPIAGQLGKNATVQDYQNLRESRGLHEPFLVQYFKQLKSIATLNFERELWTEQGITVGEKLRKAVVPSLMLTLPALVLTTLISVVIGMISAFARGRLLDKSLVFLAVLGMSISFLVYLILGQYVGAYQLSK